MKRFLQLLIGMCLVFSMNTPAPANAIFGLSKCEKVQKQVISIEKDINSKLDYLKDFEGKVLRGKPLSVYMSVNNHVTYSKFKDKLWKIGYNNPKCFTNTQKLLIKKLPKNEDQLFSDYMNNGDPTFLEIGLGRLTSAKGKYTYFTTGECKDPLAQLMRENCTKSITYTLEFAKNWKSLYEY